MIRMMKHILFYKFGRADWLASSILLLTLLPYTSCAQSFKQLMYYGNQAYQSDDYDLAIDNYNQAYQLDSMDYRSLFNSGNAHLRKEDNENAIAIWQTVISQLKDKKEIAKAYHNIGNAYLTSGKIQEAIDAYKNGLRNNPSDHETRYNLAFAQKLLDNQEDQDNQNDDNQDGEGDDQEQDKDKDKEDGENDEENEGENEDSDEGDEEQEQEQQNQEQDGDEDEKEQQQTEPKEMQLSQEDMARLLDALEREEKDIQQKLREQRGKVHSGEIEKDW
jgi:Ca-activated chloride channel homolog